MAKPNRPTNKRTTKTTASKRTASSKRTAPKPAAQSTQAALEEIDRVFHEKARLGIMTTIVSSPEGLNFIDLKRLCELTDGNLNRHLKVLVDTGILKVKKSGQGRNTNSHYEITKTGRSAFGRYLTALETILLAAKGESATASTNSKRSRGLAEKGLALE